MASEGTGSSFLQEGLCVIVVGASGDLAKKKTYPSLLNLFQNKLLPEETVIWGYARSAKTHESLRAHLKPGLLKLVNSEDVVDSFLSRCFYKRGSSYGDADAFGDMVSQIKDYEVNFSQNSANNRLFYLAVPPNVFGETGLVIKRTALQNTDKGWSRIIIEKPFGRDLKSCNELLKILATQFEEQNVYRIDHYLGKEMVQNLLTLRFDNSWFERIWNKSAIQSVIISFKEKIGTEGRGGYFDQFGIIRDVLQNHLLQVLTLLAMEAPVKAEDKRDSDQIRDSKVRVLEAMPILQLEDCLLGQYEGYRDDPTLSNANSNTATYAAIRCFVDAPRWTGVPFIMEAGKALDEAKVEIRIQFRPPSAAEHMFNPDVVSCLPRNELVIRLQPDPAIYMTTNIKEPGFSTKTVTRSLSMEYTKFESPSSSHPDAYTRLILDVLQGRQGSFVRDDELRKSWEMFTPLLHRIETEKVRPHVYKQGATGPKGRNSFFEGMGGYVHHPDLPFPHSAL